MKIIIYLFFTISVLICTSGVYGAMPLSDKPIGFGAKAGVVNSIFVPKDGSSGFSKWQNGMQLGGYFRFHLNEYFSAGAELLYSQYGTYDLLDTALFYRANPLLSQMPVTEKNKRFDVRMECLDIPVILMGKYAVMPDLKSYIYIGANMTINIASDVKITRQIDISGQIGERHFYSDVTERIRRFDYSPIAGAGVTSEMLGLKLCLDLRYKYGITNINKVEGLPGFTNQAWIITLGIGL